MQRMPPPRFMARFWAIELLAITGDALEQWMPPPSGARPFRIVNPSIRVELVAPAATITTELLWRPSRIVK